MSKQSKLATEGDKMAQSAKNKLTPAQLEFQKFAKEREPKRPALLNIVRAFLVGGLICVIGQGLQLFFIKYFNFTVSTAGNPTGAILIITAVFLTGLGVYDRIAQWAGAGSAVPVTGFANSMVAAAIEHRSEGFVLGVGAKMFEMAGAVIVYGVFATFVVAVVQLTLRAWGGG
jgi:stage V sporulation protein AC